MESLDHAGFENQVKVNINWINSRAFKESTKILENQDAILVPGGFGNDGVKGKMMAIEYARVHKIPFLGICFGLQLAVLEFAQNVAKLNKAYSSELTSKPEDDAQGVIGLMTEWENNKKLEKRSKSSDLGGTMRLGAYESYIKKGSKAFDIYKADKISERHRHRYEVNIKYREELEKFGLKISGLSPDGRLPEIIEITDHPFFIGVQFHPELKSRPFKAHPLFIEFIKSAIGKR